MGKFILIIIVIAVGVGFWMFRTGTKNDSMLPESTPDMGSTKQAIEQPIETIMEEARKNNATAREFSMTSYYDDKGAWFSLKEMRVKKGDLVLVKVTNTKGMHDFTLDEYGIKVETPLNEEKLISFIADKTGTFEYYCSKPGHRAKGQWGKLIVE